MTEVYQKIIGGPSPQNLEYKVSMQSLGSSKINVHKASKAVKIELWEKWSGGKKKDHLYETNSGNCWNAKQETKTRIKNISTLWEGSSLGVSLNLSGKGCGDNFKYLVFKWYSSASDLYPRNFLPN